MEANWDRSQNETGDGPRHKGADECVRHAGLQGLGTGLEELERFEQKRLQIRYLTSAVRKVSEMEDCLESKA
jgi:hypothetical protein